MRLAAVVLILLDAALTCVGVGYLGAREVVLAFVNQNPALMWPVAFAKVLAVLYLAEKAEKYAWVEYILHLNIFTHAVAVVNNMYWILLRLLFL